MTLAKESNIESLLLESSNGFTSRIFSEITKANPGRSVVLSAFSVMSPLAEIALASVGGSHDEILQAIGMPNDDTTKAVFSRAYLIMQSTDDLTVKTANKIYVAEDYKLNRDFAVLAKDAFKSDVQNVDFQQSYNAAEVINNWVEDQTNHRIKDLVNANSLDGNTRALLVNAIYFKGLWKNPFDKVNTKDDDFHVNKNKIIKVPMMYRKGQYRYTENNELKSQILEIAYKGFEVSLIVVLPRDVEGIVQLHEKLKELSILDNILKQAYETEVEVYLPKFKIQTTTDLKDVLGKMNITKMFDAQKAQLLNLVDDSDDLYITSAIQKAYIEVNEEGAEAAAGNVFGIIGAPLPIIPIVFHAARPFYFAIKMNELILFNGVMYGA